MNDDMMPMEQVGKMPSSMNVTQKPAEAARAIRRRFVTQVTNNNTYGPDQYANIYIDTQTPGSFIDPDSIYLCFDFTIQNSIYSVDYTDFGCDGVGGAVIGSLKWFCGGASLEEIQQYGIASQWYNTVMGENLGEARQYFSALLKDGGYYSRYHRNFIKPPMVDRRKNIMFGQNPMGVGVSTLNKQSMYMNSYSTTINGAYQSGFNLAASQFLAGGGISYMQQTMGGTANNQNILELINSNIVPGAETTGSFTGLIGYNYVQGQQWEAVTATGGLFHSFPWLNTLFIQSTPTSVYTPAMLSSVNAITPMDFPNLFSPFMVDILDRYIYQYGTINQSQVMANLASVKCYPIGMYSTHNAWDIEDKNLSSVVYTSAANGAVSNMPDNFIKTNYSLGAASTAANGGLVASAPQYRITYKPLSGILGRLASKMLVSFLIASQSLYLQIQFAPAAIALNVSADPCRRICGTIRDYMRNIGYCNGAQYGIPSVLYPIGNSNSIYNASGAGTNGGSAYAPGYFPARSIQILNNSQNPGAFNECSLSTVFAPSSCEGSCLVFSNSAEVAVANKIGSLNQLGGFSNPTPPTPQYILTQTPWAYKVSNPTPSSLNYACENEVFYGTYLLASTPQSRRIFSLTSTGTATSIQNVSPTSLTYTIQNLSLIGDQIIVADSVAKRVIETAAAGDYTVYTKSLRTYVIGLNNNATQDIVCPFTITTAEGIYFIFQNSQQYSGVQSYWYDSFCGFNPFALVDKGANNTVASITGYNGAGVSTTLTGVGWSNQLTYVPTRTVAGDFAVQLRIANNYFPVQPLQSIQEIAAENQKSLSRWADTKYIANIGGDFITLGLASGGSSGSAPSYATPATSIGAVGMYYDVLTNNTFMTAFVDNDILDDQTITTNPDFVPLMARTSATAFTSNIYNAAGTKTSVFNGWNFMCPRGYCCTELFKSPTSTFYLGFKLDTFSRDDGLRGGMYLTGVSTVLSLKGAIGLTGYQQQYRAVAIIPHQVSMRYNPGGNLIWMY